MAHNLHGERMAYVGDPPWHGLGKEVPHGVGVEEMIVAAGLDWGVWLQPAPGALIDPRSGKHDRNLVMRRPVDSWETENVALGWVGHRYEPLQNMDAFRFFEPFVEREWAHFETAGALGRGEVVWVLARLRKDINVGAGESDKIGRYLLLSNSHNGSSAVSVRFTCVRVVCQNTLILSSARGRSKSAVSIPHTRRVHANLRIEQANKLKEMADTVFGGASVLFNEMAKRIMTLPETEQYLEALYPRTKKQKKDGDVPLSWSRVFSVLEDHTVTPRATRNTVWGLYNAVVRDEDFRLPHASTTGASTRGARLRQSARLSRIWFGNGSQLKLRALGEARRLVASPSAN